MAYLRGLVILALLAFSPSAFASGAACGPSAQYCYTTEAEALADCNAVVVLINAISGAHVGPVLGNCSKQEPGSQYWLANSPYVGYFGISEYRGGTTAQYGTTGTLFANWRLYYGEAEEDDDEECMERNIADPSDPDGRGVADRIWIKGTAPSHYCNAGCNINVSPSMGEDGGINPWTGETVTYTHHEQIYGPDPATNETVCGTDVETNQDNNPPDSTHDPSTQPATDPGTWSCDYEHGTCTDPNGDPNFCTFTGDPPVRSSCVPAGGDGDNDGVPNDQDTSPNDPTNSEDTTGDESDNTSSGGGSCLSPPVSTGEPITAQIAYQTWATRCAIEALPHGNPTSGPVTVNVAANTAANADIADIKSNTASTATSAAAINSKLGTETSGDLDARGNDGQPANAAAAGHGDETEYGAEGLDDSGMGFGNTCPEIPDVMVLGQTLHFDTSLFCNWMTAAGFLVFAFAALACLRIIGSAA